METTHLTIKSALATKAQHFVKAGAKIHVFADENAAWRFHQQANITPGSGEPSGVARYYTRQELAAVDLDALPRLGNGAIPQPGPEGGGPA